MNPTEPREGYPCVVCGETITVRDCTIDRRHGKVTYRCGRCSKRLRGVIDGPLEDRGVKLTVPDWVKEFEEKKDANGPGA